MSNSKGLQAKGHPNQQLPVTPSITKRKQAQQRDQSMNKKQFPKSHMDGKENDLS
ncbi:hypothetical protein AB205_0166610 [Aquarana catesbeiana]|uniref:Uncharacterized protein n=1 Tax=Aquarana catesbeiana TaxID=8400 RepID=A0A2G9RKM6_AQUCT|nr:hypothetical protein AB205_0166610 [Aquarana catesbeiana]